MVLGSSAATGDVMTRPQLTEVPRVPETRLRKPRAAESELVQVSLGEKKIVYVV